jgi:hypothetical protein
MVATQDAVMLRSMMLIASAHYCVRAGGLDDFRTTYIYHSLQCIQTVNERLARSHNGPDLMCMRLIASLCMAEVS